MRTLSDILLIKMNALVQIYLYIVFAQARVGMLLGADALQLRDRVFMKTSARIYKVMR